MNLKTSRRAPIFAPNFLPQRDAPEFIQALSRKGSDSRGGPREPPKSNIIHQPAHLALDIGWRANIVSAMSQPATSARLLQTALGLGLIIPGIAFTIFLWASYVRAQETRRWTPTPCLILSSQVITEHPSSNSPPAYRASIRYRYAVNSVTFEENHIHREGADGSTSDRAKAEAVCAKYPPFRETTCFVNPAKPDSAVLEHGTKAGLYTIWFPLLFVAGGAGMVWSAWRTRVKKQNTNHKLQSGGDPARQPPSL